MNVNEAKIRTLLKIAHRHHHHHRVMCQHPDRGAQYSTSTKCLCTMTLPSLPAVPSVILQKLLKKIDHSFCMDSTITCAR
jgi:hypothetical protein